MPEVPRVQLCIERAQPLLTLSHRHSGAARISVFCTCCCLFSQPVCEARNTPTDHAGTKDYFFTVTFAVGAIFIASPVSGVTTTSSMVTVA